MSWSVEEGTILMGGGHQYGARLTTEIVKHGGTTETSFHMKYGTMYETIQCNFYFIFLRSRPVDPDVVSPFVRSHVENSD